MKTLLLVIYVFVTFYNNPGNTRKLYNLNRDSDLDYLDNLDQEFSTDVISEGIMDGITEGTTDEPIDEITKGLTDETIEEITDDEEDEREIDKNKKPVFPIENCGKKTNRIVGGVVSAPHEWPWNVVFIANLNIENRTVNYIQCGGTLITGQWIVTAAQCITNTITGYNYIDFQNSYALIGSYNLTSDLESNLYGGKREGRLVQVEKVYVHPYYNYKTNINDVALVKLYQSIKFDRKAQPICLCDDPHFNPLNKKGIITGWGEKGDGKISNLLRQAELPIITNKECINFYNSSFGINQCTLCAGLPNQGIDACYGDAGGPLMIKKNNKWVQVGITSNGDLLCGRSPGIYTRICCPFVYNWIKETVIKYTKETKITYVLKGE